MEHSAVTAALVGPGTLTFADLVQLLYGLKFSGSITVHFGDGVPTAVDLVLPPVTRRLDKQPRQRAFSRRTA